MTQRSWSKALAASAVVMIAPGCSTSEWDAIAEGMQLAAKDLAVTMTQVTPYGCGLNAQRRPVCDDTGDGFADRYGNPNVEYVAGWVYAQPTRVNEYGEAFEYDGRCNCWRREPSLDTRPK